LRQVFSNGKSSWIDDITTKNKIESFNEVLYKSINDGCNEVEQMYGSNWTNWKWGDAHTVTHRHTLSGVKILDWLFDLNVGPYRSGGSDKTTNAGGYSINNPYFQTSGASMRRIVDFDNLNETQFILPTGQSGLSNSRHYKDQADLYHRGEYRTTWFDEKYIRSSMEFRHLEFYPE
jgi:penicillin amidase